LIEYFSIIIFLHSRKNLEKLLQEMDQ